MWPIEARWSKTQTWSNPASSAMRQTSWSAWIVVSWPEFFSPTRRGWATSSSIGTRGPERAPPRPFLYTAPRLPGRGFHGRKAVDLTSIHPRGPRHVGVRHIEQCVHQHQVQRHDSHRLLDLDRIRAYLPGQREGHLEAARPRRQLQGRRRPERSLHRARRGTPRRHGLNG